MSPFLASGPFPSLSSSYLRPDFVVWTLPSFFSPFFSSAPAADCASTTPRPTRRRSPIPKRFSIPCPLFCKRVSVINILVVIGTRAPNSDRILSEWGSVSFPAQHHPQVLLLLL